MNCVLSIRNWAKTFDKSRCFFSDNYIIACMFAQVEDRSTMLRSVSNDVVSAKTDLINVTPQQVDCIGTVIKCKPLLDWLKGNIRGNSFYPVCFFPFICVLRLPSSTGVYYTLPRSLKQGTC